jgi:HlyD family secretion protein
VQADDEEMEQLGRADAAGVEIRSEEIDEILTSMPGGLLRWGTTVVFCTLLVLLGISWFIAYPDVVKGRITITTPTPPVRLVARVGGEVAQVFAADGATVRAGQPVLLLRSPASYADVQALSASLAALESALGSGGPLPAMEMDRPLALGPLQTPFSALRQAYSDFRLARDEAFYAQRLAGARAQVSELERLRTQLQAQQALQEQQLALAGRARDRTRQMVAQRLAATIDADKAEDDYLQRSYAVENGRTSLINNEVQLNTQRAALLELEQRRSDEGARGMVALGNATHALRAAIGAWEQEHVLRSPVAGTVSFFRELSTNQFVAASEPLVAVIPAARGMVGRVTLSGLGAGKVVPGQRVIIRLDGYPYREYGTVEGRVTKISQLAFQKDARSPEVTYLADVSLPRGLSTSYNRALQFRQEMVGEADVVAEDLRLLERVFNNLRALQGTE